MIQDKTNKYKFALAKKEEHDELNIEVTEALVKYGAAAVLNWNVKIGQSNGIDNDDFEFHVARLMKHVYKLCFHAKKTKHTTDEDPM